MSNVWQAKRLYEKIRHLSDLFSQSCLTGNAARGDKVELVNSFMKNQMYLQLILTKAAMTERKWQ